MLRCQVIKDNATFLQQKKKGRNGHDGSRKTKTQTDTLKVAHTTKSDGQKEVKKIQTGIIVREGTAARSSGVTVRERYS